MASNFTSAVFPAVTNTEQFLNHYNSWHWLKRGIAILWKCVCWLRNIKFHTTIQRIDAKQAEMAIIFYLQQGHLRDASSSLQYLKLFPCEMYGYIRIAGHLRHSLLVQGLDLGCSPAFQTRRYHQHKTWLHKQYWPLGGKRYNSFICRCHKCHVVKAPLCKQVMSDLPASRVIGKTRPFARVGVDCFGPLQWWQPTKGWGMVFFCESSWAICVIMLYSLP